MKKFSLILSLLLTLIVFSMSFASGEDSGRLSLEVSNFILKIITDLFPNNTIVLEELHIVVRKSAHIIEYMILGVSWFFTGKLWNLSLMRVLIVGLMIASVDELIQIFALDRGPSMLDTLGYDFLPFLFSSLLLFYINNKNGKEKMSGTTLSRLQSNKISKEEAYKELFTSKRTKMPFTRRAHFVKLRIIVPEEKGATRFLGVLFFFPLPLCIVRFALSFVKKESLGENVPLTKSEILDMISYKGIRVQVTATSGEKVLIRTI